MSGGPSQERNKQSSPSRDAVNQSSSPDYEALSKDVRRKMEYLRALRFAAQTRKQRSRLPGESESSDRPAWCGPQCSVILWCCASEKCPPLKKGRVAADAALLHLIRSGSHAAEGWSC